MRIQLQLTYLRGQYTMTYAYGKIDGDELFVTKNSRYVLTKRNPIYN